MSDKTGIEWTDATWNPLRGCSRVSDGCRNCYAESVANRFKGPGMPYEGLIAKGGQWNGQIKLVPEMLDQPLRWRRPRRIFVNSMSDLFHENVPTEYIDKVFAVMAMAHWHTFQVLTKRPERMRNYFAGLKSKDAFSRGFNACSYFNASDADIERIGRMPQGLPNVWLGVSVEDQATADERIPLLLQTPAAVRWISAEPLLGPITMRWFCAWPENAPTTAMNPYNAGTTNELDGLRRLDWVVVGGESGKDARPMHPDWARALRDQCAVAGVAFLFKQWGEWQPTEPAAGGDLGGDIRRGTVEIVKAHGENNGHLERGDVFMRRIGKKIAGRLLDGVQHDGYPRGAV